MKHRRIILGAIVVAGLAGVVALERRGSTTTINPRPLFYLIADTERELERLPLELTRVSEEEENSIGRELALQYGVHFRQGKTPESKRIAEYISAVGRRVASHVKRKGIRYNFYYRDESGFVDAYAMPGGQVVFGRGLLELLESEDELAAILGHEIAHVDERHAIERLQYELKSRKLGLRGLYRLGRPAILIFEAGYTKEREVEADRAGLELAVAAGYSPSGATEVMKRFIHLQRATYQPAASPLDELMRVPIASLREYFRSHPPAPERISAMERQIQARGWNAAQPMRPMPVRAIFLTELADGLDRRGLYDRAIARYEQALQLDANYLPAWQGLARAAWRKGDAAKTISASQAVIARNPNETQAWHWLAAALAAEDRAGAPAAFSRFFQKVSAEAPRPLLAETLLTVQIQQFGLEAYAGQVPEIAKFWREAAGRLNAKSEAEMRRRLAWWLFHGGRAIQAEQELQAARQRYPQAELVATDLAWVLSELGRQADAQALANGVEEDDELLALKSAIAWRTDQRDRAKTHFQAAAERDPVWLEPKWIANTFSPATASVLEELRTAELARRKEAEMRAARRSGKAPAQPTAPR